MQQLTGPATSRQVSAAKMSTQGLGVPHLGFSPIQYPFGAQWMSKRTKLTGLNGNKVRST